MFNFIKKFTRQETSHEFIEARRLFNKTNKVWDDIKNGKIQSVKKVEELVKSFKDELNSFSHKHQYQKNNMLFELSQSISDLQDLVLMTPTDDLRPVRVILNNKFKSSVYYIFHRSAIKLFATQIPWFFPYYTKCDIIKENKEYVLIKEDKISNLVLVANIVMDENKDLLFEKYPDEESALTFYKGIKNA